MITRKAEDVELILSERFAEERLTGQVDLVTEMVNVKHPCEKGIHARKGIEY